MVGRLEGRSLQVLGVGSATGWRAVVETARSAVGMPVVMGDSPWGPSDHRVFYEAGVPVVHLFTGLHGEYHLPTDTFEKIDFEGLTGVANFTLTLTAELATGREALVYRKVEASGSGRPGGSRVVLGIVPVYGASEDGGAGVASVASGGPAAVAGIGAGDVIAGWNGEPVADLRGLAYRLADADAGPVTLTVRRDGVTRQVEVVLRLRSGSAPAATATAPASRPAG